MIKYGLYRRFEKFSELSLPETFSISKSKKKKEKNFITKHGCSPLYK